MRDIALVTFLIGSIPFILWRPTYGALLWVWLSVMNPHRLTWELRDIRFAYLIAIATLAGLLISRVPKRLPVTPVTVVLLLIVLWETLTTVFAMAPAASQNMWKEVIKIQLMVFVALYVMHSKQHIEMLIWVLAGSVAFYGVKGGLFTLETGGEHLVYGPVGTFIEENNALALATIMTIPLLYYLFQRATENWERWVLAVIVRWSLLAAMVLCGFSALGSHSRGGFLAISAMIAFLWWKSRSKAVTGLVLIILVPLAIGFMPDKWMDRMQTIETYEQDRSAMGRIHVWTTATNLAQDRFLGGGFNMNYSNDFARYAPLEDVLMSTDKGIRAVHSIYFQMLGEHGFVGLALYLLLWFLGWRDASWIIKQSQGHGQLHWASDLARMIQVSLVGFFVGGAFLSLAQWDVPYYLLVALVLTRLLVEKELKALEQKDGVPNGLRMDETKGNEHGVVAGTRLEAQTNTDKHL